MNNKVLFLVNHDLVIYNFRKELVLELLKENYDVIISSPYGERIDYFTNIGCKYIETNISRRSANIFKEFKLLNFYKKIIKQISPLVVLTYTIKPNIYGGIASKKYDTPYIANITGLGTSFEKHGLLRKIIVKLHKYALSNVKTLFFQNIENMLFFNQMNISPSKHVLIPGSGVNLEHYTYTLLPNDGVIRFAFISRIMKEKGIDLYLKAASIIK